MANASGCMVIERFAKFPSKMKMSGGVHAIQFKTSRNVYLFGVGLSGASGSFTAKVRIMRCLQASAPAKNSKEDIAAEQLTLTISQPTYCAPIFFATPLLIHANVWTEISADLGGNFIHYGTKGNECVEADGVVFTFRNSSLSSMYTRVSRGQFPQIYFKIAPSVKEES